jgi:peptidyl-prolyl cis-trans isomerase C
VEVNGKKLTWRQAETEISNRLAAVSGQASAEQLQMLHRQTMQRFVNQFILRTLLLDEAERRKIEVTREDQDKAPAAMKSGPLGEERRPEDVIADIRINKLLENCVTNDVSVSEEEITAFRTLPENVQARHILIRVAEGDSDQAKGEKKARIEQIRKELLAGADFSEMAGKHSDCPSRQQGGYLGSFPRGQMVKPFEDAAFSQEPDAIGPVVETKFGYHIIQVLAHNKPADFAREKVVEILKARKQQVARQSFVEGLAEKADIRPPLPSKKRPDAQPPVAPPAAATNRPSATP